MVVCKFFLEGRCRFGDGCKNEHPRGQSQGNSYAPLSNAGAFGGRPRSNASAPQLSSDEAENIKKDLTAERPKWPLSCYAPTQDVSQHLIQARWDPAKPLTDPDQGAPEFSPEEMRYKFYLSQASGQRDAYINWESGLMQNLTNQVNSILNDLPGALRHSQNTSIPDNQNRLKQVKTPTGSFGPGQQQSTGFGQGPPANAGFAAPSRPGFGAASALGPAKPAFGGPSSLGGGSTFGGPSALGGGSAFGRASALGGGGTAFGQPSGGAAASGFGSASTLGQQSNPFASNQQAASPSITLTKPTPPPSSFGSASQQPAFGQSAFGAASKPAFGQAGSGFGSASKPAFGQAGSGFGNVSTPAFGQSPFAASAAQQTPAGVGFGGQQQQQQATSSGFGQAGQLGANKPSPFGTSQPSTTGGFGQASQQAPSNPSPFGQPSQAASRPNPFAPQPGPSTQQSPFAQRPQFGNTNNLQSPALATPGPTGGPNTWKGKRIVYPEKDVGHKHPCYEIPDQNYANQGGVRLERIWFPTGPPPGPALTCEALPHVYENETVGPQLREVYEFVAKNGVFKDGLIPEIPPKKEWINYDF